MSQYFPQPCSCFGNASGDASSFTKKVDLAGLKSDVDKLDMAKLRTVPTDLI